MVFSNSRINRGLPAEGFLDVRASSLAPDNNSLTGLQLVFDDISINLPFNTKIIAGGTNTEWISPEQMAADQAAALLAAEKSQLMRDTKRLDRRAKFAKRKGKLKVSRNLSKKARQLKQKLSSL